MSRSVRTLGRVNNRVLWLLRLRGRTGWERVYIRKLSARELLGIIDKAPSLKTFRRSRRIVVNHRLYSYIRKRSSIVRLFIPVPRIKNVYLVTCAK